MKTEKLVFVIKIFLSVVLLTPLVLGPFGLNMSEYPKAVFFRSLVEIIFILYIFLLALDKTYLPQKNILLISVAFFYLVCFITSILGINFYRSFFGDLQRGEGLVLYLHLFIFFVVLSAVFHKKEDWMWFFRVSGLVNFFSCVAAILQQLNVYNFFSINSHISGTLSNPDLFANYIVLAFFIAVFMLFSEKNIKIKIAWIALAILDCYVLFFSKIRGAWVGFSAGIFICSLYYFFKLNKKNKIIVTCFAVIGILCLAAVIYANFNKISNLDGRGNIWKADWQAVKDRPILGWGNESAAFLYDKYSYNIKQSSDGVYFDRPHNKILEVLLYNGIIGLLAYLAIFAVIFYVLWKKRDLRSFVLAGFFASGFMQNIFSFDNICTYILFFSALAFINFNYFPEKSISQPVENKFVFEKICLAFCLSIFIGMFFYQINIKPTLASMYFPKAVSLENSDMQASFAQYSKSISQKTFYDKDLVLTFTDRMLYLLEDGFGRNISSPILNKLLSLKPVLYGFLKSKDELNKEIYEYIARIDEWDVLLYNSSESAKDMQEVLQEGGKIYPANPFFPQLMGELYIIEGKNSEGEKSITKSCDLDSLCNQALLYKNIGYAYFKNSDFLNAGNNFKKAVYESISYRKEKLADPLPSTPQFIDQVALFLYKQNKIDEAKKIYNDVLPIYPEYKEIFLEHLKAMSQ